MVVLDVSKMTTLFGDVLRFLGRLKTVRLGEAFLGHDNLTIFCSVFSFLPFLETSVTDWLLAVWDVTVSPYIKAEVLYGL